MPSRHPGRQVVSMSNPFFEHPILNSPYEYPSRHWDLDEDGQATQKIIERRRHAIFITPIPKPKQRKAPATQASLVFNEGKGISTEQQQYDPMPMPAPNHFNSIVVGPREPFHACQLPIQKR